MRELFNQIFDNVFFTDVFFVTENPGIIEIENIFKKDNKIVTENIKKEYSLPNYELKNDDSSGYNNTQDNIRAEKIKTI